MAERPYRIIDRRGIGAAQNSLIEAATTSHKRKSWTNQDKDLHRLLSPTGRRTMLSYSRALYANNPQVFGMLQEQANLAVNTWIPQYYGRNKAWGEQAEEWLWNWHRIMDYLGWPWDFETWAANLGVCPRRVGDVGSIMCKN